MNLFVSEKYCRRDIYFLLNRGEMDAKYTALRDLRLFLLKERKKVDAVAIV